MLEGRLCVKLHHMFETVFQDVVIGGGIGICQAVEVLEYGIDIGVTR